MSSFIAMTKATDSALESGVDEWFSEWRPAEWIDNYYGIHQYGIRFIGDPFVRADNGDFICNLDMKVKHTTKESK